MKNIFKILFIVTVFGMGTAHAKFKYGENPSEACKKIGLACYSAGFTTGDWKTGSGVWHNCVEPILDGKKISPKNKQPLPSVDKETIKECKASRK